MSTWTGAISTDWNNAGNWAAGGIGTGIPTSTTDAIFSGTPVNNCVMGANRVCRALTFTGYTGTLTVATFTLQVFNNITFQSDQSSRIIGTTGILSIASNSTITSNNGIWNLNILFVNSGGAYVLPDDLRVTGSYLGSGGGTQTITGVGNIYIGGNVTMTGTFNTNSNLIMNGSGTYSGSAIGNLEINTTGSIIITGSVTFTRRFIITAAGSITMTAANVSIIGGTTVNIGGRTIGSVNFISSLGTTTISTDMYCTSFTGGNGQVINGPGRIYVNGPYAGHNGGGNVTIELIGSGSIANGITNNLAINTTGIYTFTSNIGCGASITITHNQGTINPQTFLFQNNVTTLTFNINAPGFNLYNWTLPNAGSPQTMTINSTNGNVINILNNLTFVNNSPIFAGNTGWICANLLFSLPGNTITLQAGVTYTTTTSVNMLGTNAVRILMTSSSGSISAIWTLSQGASQSIAYVNSTRIDSSGGQTIWSFGVSPANISTSINWNVGAKPSAYGFIGL
jgi:hypothetical protein